MKTLDELINQDDPGISLIREWIEECDNDVALLPPSEKRDEVLLELQVTTRSSMGAVAYETGGILIEHGWLRFLGSGHPKLTRTLSGWNQGRSNGLFLIADDAVGGFFAINGGALGDRFQDTYYLAPDGLEWEALEIGYTDFFQWSLTSKLSDFYEDLRWPSWKDDVAALQSDQCFGFFPFLWTEQGSVQASNRRPLPASEAFELHMDVMRQLNSQ